MWKECNITYVPIMSEVVSVCVSPRLHLSEYVIIRARRQAYSGLQSWMGYGSRRVGDSEQLQRPPTGIGSGDL